MEYDPIGEHQDRNGMILEQRATVRVWVYQPDLEGWVVSPSRCRLLFWVPPEFRERLLMSGQQLVLGVEHLELDLSQFVHGPDWAECYQP